MYKMISKSLLSGTLILAVCALATPAAHAQKTSSPFAGQWCSNFGTPNLLVMDITNRGTISIAKPSTPDWSGRGRITSTGLFEIEITERFRIEPWQKNYTRVRYTWQGWAELDARDIVLTLYVVRDDDEVIPIEFERCEF